MHCPSSLVLGDGKDFVIILKVRSNLVSYWKSAHPVC